MSRGDLSLCETWTKNIKEPVLFQDLFKSIRVSKELSFISKMAVYVINTVHSYYTDVMRLQVTMQILCYYRLLWRCRFITGYYGDVVLLQVTMQISRFYITYRFIGSLCDCFSQLSVYQYNDYNVMVSSLEWALRPFLIHCQIL